MSPQSWTELAIAVAALAAMSLLAMIEATSSLVPRQRLRQAGEQPGAGRSAQRLLDPRRSLVASLELVQAIAVALAASLLSSVIGREYGRYEHVLAVGIVALVYLVFGQALPRAFAACQPERATHFLLALANPVALILTPLTALGDLATRAWGRLLPEAPDRAALGAEDELRRAIEAPDDGIIEPEEREMIDAVLELEDTPVRDIMVPRVDMVAVSESQTPAEILATISSTGHSRVPVYRDTIDQIIGILYAKDLLPFVLGNTERLPVSRLVRRAFVVPESKRIDDLLAELRRNRVHIAIVADEYGGTAGLVTIEDILETIVGDIQDEYDVEPVLLERISDREVVVNGSIPIDEVEDALGVDLEEADDEVSTMAGFVHMHLERLPEVGDRFDADGVRCEILEVDGRRLRRLRVIRLEGLSDEPAPETNEESTGQ